MIDFVKLGTKGLASGESFTILIISLIVGITPFYRGVFRN